MLHFLTDEHISPAVARELLKRCPGATIVALQHWRDRALLGADDRTVLTEAAKDGLTFVTYDQKTIRPLLKEWAEQGVRHLGVVFVDEKSIRPNSIGELVNSLAALWKSEHRSKWADRVVFLRSIDR